MGIASNFLGPIRRQLNKDRGAAYPVYRAYFYEITINIFSRCVNWLVKHGRYAAQSHQWYIFPRLDMSSKKPDHEYVIADPNMLLRYCGLCNDIAI